MFSKDTKVAAVVRTTAASTSNSYQQTRPAKGTVAKIRIVEKTSANSAANTANQASFGLFPCNTTEGKAMATLYDTARCTNVEVRVHFRTQNAAGVPTAPILHGDAAFTYDPANGTVYGSVTGVLESTNACGPFHISTIGGQCGGPQPNNALYFSKRYKVPKVVDPGLVTDLLGSNWVSAADTSVLVGYFKLYVDPLGAGILSGFDFYTFYDMEYKNRT